MELAFSLRHAFWRMILALALLAAFLFLPGANPVSSAAPVWGSKPVLAFFLLDPQLADRLQVDLGLTPEQSQEINRIVQSEDLQIQALEAESLAILDDPGLTRPQKTEWLAQTNYNQRVADVLTRNQHALLALLGNDQYKNLVRWIEARWSEQRTDLDRRTGGLKVLAMLAPKAYPRSFAVYATRYDAGERKIVALPDKCLKFANGGALQCDGYAYGQGYSVAISYEGNLVVGLVGESGPWNIDDSYWARASDPQPRRMFTDLPLGMPEAQAAYFNGYNSGLDQFGRLVTSPVAIDVSKALAADLGLGPGNNLVTVSFLWTEGWDSPRNQPGMNAPASGQAAPPAAIGWQTVTPNPDGSITHVVQAGQTLVGIATVYNISLADLLAINNLTMQSIIQPGDQILVKPANPTQTPVASATNTVRPTQRPPAIRTTAPPPLIMPSSAPSPTRISTAPAVDKTPRTDWVMVAIIVVALAGVGLLAWGLVIQRRK